MQSTIGKMLLEWLKTPEGQKAIQMFMTEEMDRFFEKDAISGKYILTRPRDLSKKV